MQGAIDQRREESFRALKLLLPNALGPDHAVPVEKQSRGASLENPQQRATHDHLLPFHLDRGESPTGERGVFPKLRDSGDGHGENVALG